VVVVDLYGQSADYTRILDVCSEYEIPVIEDAAEALGATLQEKPVGGFGKLGIFSFNGNKIITTSGGGMLVSHDDKLIEQARFLASQARDPAPHYQHSAIGYNYRMSNVLAAIGRAQLPTLERRIDARRHNFECYQTALGDLPGIRFMPEASHGRSTRWLTCLTIDPEAFGATREDVREALERQDIEARPVWKPMHLQPVFSGCRVRGGAVAQSIFEQGLCLPSGSNLSDQDRERVIETVRGACPNWSESPHPPLASSHKLCHPR
jgi:dTDP-4-amino-4,6-dideoxygalactose transaminase